MKLEVYKHIGPFLLNKYQIIVMIISVAIMMAPST